ncbi:hypothetical protein BC832DRAFT_434627 [Gaertneriomyces semiglobifer]|nr:hypothetical protein BC832DRAFT_434627 [Gaertneriomyces semiglobifer]
MNLWQAATWTIMAVGISMHMILFAVALRLCLKRGWTSVNNTYLGVTVCFLIGNFMLIPYAYGQFQARDIAEHVLPGAMMRFGIAKQTLNMPAMAAAAAELTQIKEDVDHYILVARAGAKVKGFVYSIGAMLYRKYFFFWAPATPFLAVSNFHLLISVLVVNFRFNIIARVLQLKPWISKALLAIVYIVFIPTIILNAVSIAPSTYESEGLLLALKVVLIIATSSTIFMDNVLSYVFYQSMRRTRTVLSDIKKKGEGVSGSLPPSSAQATIETHTNAMSLSRPQATLERPQGTLERLPSTATNPTTSDVEKASIRAMVSRSSTSRRGKDKSNESDRATKVKGLRILIASACFAVTGLCFYIPSMFLPIGDYDQIFIHVFAHIGPLGQTATFAIFGYVVKEFLTGG